jgi:hypothetical protein
MSTPAFADDSRAVDSNAFIPPAPSGKFALLKPLLK